jgi:hypothetical protein
MNTEPTSRYVTTSDSRPCACRASWLPNVGALPTNSDDDERNVLRKPLHIDTMLNSYVRI